MGHKTMEPMKRLLIIDDSPVIRKVARRILSKLDLMISEAESGCEALEMCRSEMPHFIICDGSLSDMEVSEFIKAVKQVESEPAPMILVNFFEMNLPAIMRAKRAGATGYLLKPFNRITLEKRFVKFCKEVAQPQNEEA